MKQFKILLVVAVLVVSSFTVSCIPGRGQAAVGWSGTAYHDGIVYAGTRDGRVVAIDATTRDLLWSRPLVAEAAGGLGCGPAVVAAAMYSTPVVVDDFVYIGTYTANGGRMYALGVTDGEIIWEYPRGGGYIGTIVGGPVLSGDTFYVSSSDGRIHALALSTFTLRWESERLADKLWTSPTVIDNTLYVSTFDGHIYALAAETGELLDWTFQLEAGLASSPVIYGDTIYVGSFDNNLYAIEIGADEYSWRFQGRKWFWAAPVVYEGVVYAGSLDGRLYLFDADTGDKLGDFDAGSPIASSPVIMDDLLIVADQSGDVYVFDLSSALQDRTVPLMRVQLDAGVESTFCASEGLAYIRAEGKLYVVDVEEGWVTWEISLTAEE